MKSADPPPFGIILNEIRSGMVVPFLGAGASRAGLCSAEAPILPSGGTLAELLADDAGLAEESDTDRSDLAKISSYYVDRSNRGALRRRLRRIFLDDRYTFNALHRFLAFVANGSVIVTTNYDNLLEQAFSAIQKPYDVVVYPADVEEFANAVIWWRYGENEPQKLKPNEIDVGDLGKTNIIFKMHGSVSRAAEKWDSFVITEEDYIRFLSRMRYAVPAAFKEYFSDRAFLFLGYGLRDWNTRVLLKEVSQPGVTSWAIMRSPSRFERSLWERRNVSMFDMELEEFVRAMEARL